MDFKSLQSLIFIVEAGSITKAAKNEYISQPTLSRRLFDLELELGVKLIDRTTRNLSITSAGRLCYVFAKKIFEEKELFLCKIHEELYEELQKIEGTITIWYSFMMEYHITNLLRYLSDHMPKVNFLLSRDYTKEVESELCGEIVDIAIGPYEICRGLKNISSLELMESHFCAVLPDNHPLAFEQNIQLRQLSGMPVILLGTSGPKHIEERMLSMFSARGFAYSSILYAHDNYEQLMLAAIGKGVALSVSIASPRAPANVRYIPISDCTLNFNRICCWKSDNHNQILPSVLHVIQNWSENYRLE